MRTLLIAGALAALVVSLAACGGSSASSTSAQAVERQADLYAIDQIEKNFHKATSQHDINLMMSLWAPNATLTFGPGKTAAGKQEIRSLWLNDSKVFQSAIHWISDTAAYKIRITVNGDRGTLHFECHYLDAKTGKLEAVTGADQDVARINGQWLITNMIGATTTLSI